MAISHRCVFEKSRPFFLFSKMTVPYGQATGGPLNPSHGLLDQCRNFCHVDFQLISPICVISVSPLLRTLPTAVSTLNHSNSSDGSP